MKKLLFSFILLIFCQYTFAQVFTNFTIENTSAPLPRNSISSIIIDTCNVEIIINDTIAPIFANVPADTILFSKDDLPLVPNVTTTDNCGSANVTFKEIYSDEICTNYLTITRRWIAEDDCGNRDTATQVILIRGTVTDKYVVACNSYDYTDRLGNIYTYDVSGVHRFITEKQFSCNDTLNLHVTIVYEFRDTTDTSICKSELSTFIWEGHNFTGAGTFSDTLSTSAGCDSILTLNLQVIPSGLTVDTVAECEFYTWTGGTGSTYYTSGVYDTIITSGNICGDTLRLKLTISPDIILDTIVTNVNCFGGDDGTIDLIVSGGIKPFTFNWDNGAITQNVTSLAPGIYKVVVTDSIGCADSISVEITEPAELKLSETHVDVGYSNFDIGSIDLTVEGGTGGYSFLWSNNAITEDISSLAGGDYTVVVTDENGCIDSIIVTILQEDPQYSMDCADMITVECHEEITANPPYSTYLEYANAGGTAISDCGIDTSTFNFENKIVVDSTWCYTILRNYSIKDSCGNEMDCEQLLVVDDKEPPVFISCADTIYKTDGEIPPIYSSYSEFKIANGFADDNCGIVEWSFDLTKEVSYGTTPMEIDRTYEISDSCGNTGYCKQKIYVSGIEFMTVHIPDTAVECLTSIPPGFTYYAEFIAAGGSAESSNHNIDTSTFNLEYESDIKKTGCNYELTRTYSVWNDAPNPGRGYCTRKITVIDTIAPIFANVPADTTLFSKDDLPLVPNVTATDNCGSANVTFKEIYSDEICTNYLTITRRWIAEDDCGNIDTAEQKIIIYDDPSVKINCPPSLNVECLPNVFMSANEFINAGGTYCPSEGTDSIFLISENMIDINCPTRVERVYQIKNTNGTLSNYCTHEIIINDITDPKLNCPPNITVVGSDNIPIRLNTIFEFVDAGGSLSDNCGIDTLTFGLISEFMDTTLFPDVLKRTYYVADLCTNEDICLQQITIENATSVQDDLITEDIDFKVYPNPNNGIFSIEVGGIIGDSFIEILDNNGRLIKRLELQLDYGLQTKEIDISNEISGIYHIRLVNEEKEISKPIILR